MGNSIIQRIWSEGVMVSRYGSDERRDRLKCSDVFGKSQGQCFIELFWVFKNGMKQRVE